MLNSYLIYLKSPPHRHAEVFHDLFMREEFVDHVRKFEWVGGRSGGFAVGKSYNRIEKNYKGLSADFFLSLDCLYSPVRQIIGI